MFNLSAKHREELEKRLRLAWTEAVQAYVDNFMFARVEKSSKNNSIKLYFLKRHIIKTLYKLINPFNKKNSLFALMDIASKSCFNNESISCKETEIINKKLKKIYNANYAQYIKNMNNPFYRIVRYKENMDAEKVSKTFYEIFSVLVSLYKLTGKQLPNVSSLKKIGRGMTKVYCGSLGVK